MDATSSHPAGARLRRGPGEGRRKGLRIGVPAEYFAEGLDAEVRAAIETGIEKLRSKGCKFTHLAAAFAICDPTYYVFATAEASSNLARFDGVRYGYRAPDANTLSAMYRRSRDMVSEPK